MNTYIAYAISESRINRGIDKNRLLEISYFTMKTHLRFVPAVSIFR